MGPRVTESMRGMGSAAVAFTETYARGLGVNFVRDLSHSLVLHEGGEKKIENVGRLFVREGSGHQMNGNYLDDWFEMDEKLERVKEDNMVMGQFLDEELLEGFDVACREGFGGLWDDKSGSAGNGTRKETNGNGMRGRKLKDVSRLWCYRNGGSPDDS